MEIMSSELMLEGNLSAGVDYPCNSFDKTPSPSETLLTSASNLIASCRLSTSAQALKGFIHPICLELYAIYVYLL